MKTLLETIGNTPLVRLDCINKNPKVTLLVKLESMNPSGSVKDRIVKYIVEEAEKSGKLKPHGIIVENTSGNTGAAVAMIAAQRGYKAILTMPDKVSQEKQNALLAYGATIVVCPTSAPPDSAEHYVNKAIQIAKKTPNSFRINQYDNLLNPEAHYKTTGPELWKQTGGKIDYWIASASTGGTVCGVARYLKEKNPAIKVIMPDPIGSIYYDYFKTKKISNQGSCTYFVEGVGEDHLAKAIDFTLIDEVVPFNDKQAFDTARKLAKEEGLLAGGSSGANLFAALELAKTCNKETVIATIIPDGGIKYLSKIYNDQWMKEHKLL